MAAATTSTNPPQPTMAIAATASTSKKPMAASMGVLRLSLQSAFHYSRSARRMKKPRALKQIQLLPSSEDNSPTIHNIMQLQAAVFG
jgi:hypothetical protein